MPSSVPLPTSPLPAPTDPVRLLYAAASFTQRQQALLSARQVLAAAYPQLTDAEWVAALDQVQPPLLLPAEGSALLAPEGLAALVGCLAGTGPAASPGGRSPQPSPAARTKKQTFDLDLAVAEQLANATYWLRRSMTELVNEALAQHLAQYPEAQRPRPANHRARRGPRPTPLA